MQTGLSNPVSRAAEQAGFYIGVTCPGCGSKLKLGDSLFVLICHYCGSHLKIEMPDVPAAYMVNPKTDARQARFSIDRYLKEHDLPLTGPDLFMRYFYYPYWKIDGALLKVRNRIERRTAVAGDYGETGETEQTTEVRRTEVALTPFLTTIAAGPFLEDIPYTIGLRAEYISLAPYARDQMDEAYVSLPIEMSREKARENAERAINQLSVTFQGDFGKNRTDLLHPQFSLIFYPYVSVEMESPRYYRFLVDGLTGRVQFFRDERSGISTALDKDRPPGIELGELRVTLHRCHSCGEDLPRGRSHVYVCNNCHTVNLVDARGLDVEAIRWVEPPASSTDPLFPFWSFELAAEDSADVARMFGGVYRSNRLVVPAFRLPNFEAAYRLTQRMSAAINQIDTELIYTYHQRFRPVTLGPSEAIVHAEIMIYRARVGKAPHVDIGDIRFKPSSAQIVYLAFHEEAYFFVDSVLNAVTFEKNLVV
ncbi:MAG: hypothetical protein RBT76_03750 [candidate division Zixibacteria bacterium]|jgi:predicted RNA-binding Zn-ribbon protein involved in translation (DUF1610 family)|nr:hypothetical protein [candidate division Zixibacteria bacterium]